jgi:uncharacterized protein (TIGR01777 family)
LNNEIANKNNDRFGFTHKISTMKGKVLISGGTGLVGKALQKHLQAEGYEVALLSRQRGLGAATKHYVWDIQQQYIEPAALADTDYIIHLAGAGIADQRWTEARKKEILESRTLSSRLLFQTLQKTGHSLKAFVSASAIGFYGADTGEQKLSEESPRGQDFLADVTAAWEQEVQPIANLGIRTAMLRIGVVLAKDGGALPKLVQPIRLGAGAALGSGQQWMSWIHIQDLCRMFSFALENTQIQGPYNAVAPTPLRNEALTKLAAKVLKKPLFLPAVPAFALKLAFGEMATVVLGGNHVSAAKMAQAGFTWRYAEGEEALRDLLG